ncbi:MAG: hypothetical protein JWM78_1013 [Verrucomicrobiaceae bacterium]|nr:hypothetical protein [Verrucomicrobiaceae bacterium]
MSISSFYSSLFKVILVGPRLSLRIGEMALASAQVLTSRVPTFTTAINNPSAAAKREAVLTVREKIDGSVESFSAASSYLSNSIANLSKSSLNLESVITATQALFSSRSAAEILWRHISLTTTITLWATSLPIKMTLFGFHLFEQTSAPLHSRVVANAKRLSKVKRKK